MRRSVPVGSLKALWFHLRETLNSRRRSAGGPCLKSRRNGCGDQRLDTGVLLSCYATISAVVTVAEATRNDRNVAAVADVVFTAL
jgi:hypothetical protein